MASEEGGGKPSPPVRFRLTAKLVPSDPEIDPDILLQVGRIVSYWGRIEHHLDSGIRAMWRSPAGEPLRREMPVAFKQRLKLWIRLCRAVWSGKPTRLAEATALRDRLQGSAPMRQLITHSYWLNTPEDSKKITLCYRHDEDDGKIKYQERQIKANELKRIADDLSAIYRDLTAMSLPLLADCGILGPPRS